MSDSDFISFFGESGGIDTEDTSTNITEDTIAELREIAGRYPQKRSALLPMLHLIQSVDGKVSLAGVKECAAILEVTEAQIIGVATFYTMYKKHPVGTHLVGVCTTALCAVMGGDAIYDACSKHLGIGNDETTPDGKITLEKVECNAACDFAPIMMVNWEFMDNMTPEKAIDLLDRLRCDDDVHSTRGPKISSWRDNERVLAGFNDGKGSEGPGAGRESTLGLNIAHEHGWKAPEPTVSDAPAPDTEGRG